jgi:hypothetical protein
MRKLDRAAVPAPPCLTKYKHGRDTWEKVDGKTDRPEIRAHLGRMQGQRCAYCEGDTEALGHIEHFRTRSGHPKLTFEELATTARDPFGTVIRHFFEEIR